jgi:hypothetical protein
MDLLADSWLDPENNWLCCKAVGSTMEFVVCSLSVDEFMMLKAAVKINCERTCFCRNRLYDANVWAPGFGN